MASRSSCRVLAGVLLSVALGGCGAAARARGAARPVDTFTIDDRGAGSDTPVLSVVLRELNRDPVVAHERLDVTVDLGVVTLRGAVTRRLAKDRAVEIAGVVNGVRAIVDRIAVLREEQTDHDLEFAVAGALAHDPVTAARPVAACVHDGVVRLSGEVESIATMRIAASDVLSIPGVRGVFNDIAVRPRHVDDGAVIAAVERILADDPWLDDSHVQVRVQGGVVRLAGSVKSAAERARAESDARTSSALGLDVSALRIASAEDGTRRGIPDVAPEDLSMEEALRHALAIDPRVGAFSPTVQVRHRVVVLTGVAPNEAALRAAEDDASHVHGVAEVRNDVKARDALVVEGDDTVLSEVTDAMALDARLNALHLFVDVRRGRVHLRGTVPTSTDRMNAIAVVSSVPGAIDVDDDLVVAPTGIALAGRSALP
jgi:osmotically-inducible protein OsmY